MTNIISFKANSSYSSFRDPSVTSNQTVYYIPSKSAVVGLLGAMLGIKRDNTLVNLYSKEYLDFFAKLSIGIQVLNNAHKITVFTNHRSLKEPKAKPVKQELLENAKYRFYINTDDDILDQLSDVISTHKFTFSPCLGHSYCPAEITDLQKYDARKLDAVSGKTTNCVVLDETNPSDNETSMKVQPIQTSGSVIVEYHLHHFFKKSMFTRRVCRHWIPLNMSECNIQMDEQNTFSTFYEIDGKAHCLY